MPTTANVNYSNAKLTPAFDPELARERSVNFKASQTIAKGTILGEVTASPGVYAAYNSGHSDGTEIPKAIAIYAVATDSDGNVSLGAVNTLPLNGGGVFGVSAPVYVSGAFRTADLVGLDANAVTKLLARFENGNLSDGGVIRF